MEMLHKHPESGDILNLQDAKTFFFSYEEKAIIFNIPLFYWMKDLGNGNFKKINLWRKFGNCVLMFKKPFFFFFLEKHSFQNTGACEAASHLPS